MAAEIEPLVGPCRCLLRDVAQPERTALEAGLLAQARQPAAPFMVAADQAERAAQQGRQGRQLLAQLGGEAEAAVDQVAEDHHLPGAPVVGQIQKGIEGAPIAVAGQGDAVGLEGFGLAEMQIGKQQQPLGWIPDGLGAEQF